MKSTIKNKTRVVKDKARLGYFGPFDTNRLAWCRTWVLCLLCDRCAFPLALGAPLFSVASPLFSLFSLLSLSSSPLHSFVFLFSFTFCPLPSSPLWCASLASKCGPRSLREVGVYLGVSSSLLLCCNPAIQLFSSTRPSLRRLVRCLVRCLASLLTCVSSHTPIAHHRKTRLL